MARGKSEHNIDRECKSPNQASVEKSPEPIESIASYISRLRKKDSQISNSSSASNNSASQEKPNDRHIVGFFKLDNLSPAFILYDEVDTITILLSTLSVTWQAKDSVWRIANFKSQHLITAHTPKEEIYTVDKETQQLLFQGVPLKTDDPRMTSCEVLPDGPPRWELQVQ